ncbi:MAG TPA: alpha/beta fold hydrolase [Puia sp.]|nr:alpha/beta fold hydrolase [Puia sp.]
MKQEVPRWRIWFRWIKLVIIIYCALGIAFYYLQEAILFHPSAVQRSAVYNLGCAYRELNLPYDNETNLNIIQFNPQGDSVAKGVVLYFHGNRNNISWYAHYASNFTRRSYEVWMIDYPGFGKSTGRFTEERLYDYALQLYRLARKQFRPSDIIIYGKSMGTGIAAQLAAVRDCRYLMLETPYYSMTSLVAHYLPIYPVDNMIHYHFPTHTYLEKVTAPVVIFQGSEDGLIPCSQAKRLIPLLKPRDEFVLIEKGTHNNLNNFPLFHQKLDSLLER